MLRKFEEGYFQNYFATNLGVPLQPSRNTSQASLSLLVNQEHPKTIFIYSITEKKIFLFLSSHEFLF